mmetsp:Transcript_34807/g.82573  ORF Transcript_34807/g.82573 Transcript_34807/m.82573 type:complete len:630 (+) Transcript_34807:253-2142(+)
MEIGNRKSEILVVAGEAALVALCITVPATQFLWLSATRRPGRSATGPRGSFFFLSMHRVWRKVSLPLSGGAKHLSFQITAWALWIFCCAGLVPVFLPRATTAQQRLVPESHHQAVLGASIVCGILGEALILKSYLVFSPGGTRRPVTRAGAVAAAGAVVLSGALLSAVGVALMTFLETLPDLPSQLVYMGLAAACLLVANSCTHGLAGDLLHGDEEGSWRFFQPGVGGTVFIATQACGWILFSLALVGLMTMAAFLLKGIACCMANLYFATGALMVAGQLVLGGSLFAFRTSAGREPRLPACSIHGHVLIAGLHLPVHIFCSVVAISMVVLPLQVAVTAWVSVIIPYYGLTSWGDPAHTGRREWGRFRAFISAHIDEAMRFWVGGVSVKRSSNKELPPGKKYVFGYHPHGLYPTGAAYLSAVPAFQEALPGIQPATLVASALFLAPIIRDFAGWGGLRQVSRKSFVHALQTKGSVLLCPGGQAELIDAFRFHGPEKEVVINCRHRGFVRVALEHGAALVPVLVFGELLCLRNLFSLPVLQQLTYRALGFPVPYLLVGRWLTPIPRPHPVEFIVGDPIERDSSRQGVSVTDAEVEDIHRRYFHAIVDLFERHKGFHRGYENAKLVLSEDR